MASHGWLVGYDIGGTSARVALFTWHDAPQSARTMTCVGSLKRGLRADTSPPSILELMHAMGCELLATHELVWSQVGAIGCGIAAQMDPTHAIALNAPNLGWRDVPISKMAREVFGRDVYFFNDLNVLLWGEFVAGAAQGKQNVLAVAIGTGVGGAIVAGGKLLVGARGQAAEIGHVKVVPRGGKLCGCGESGCVEAYAGGVHLERAVREIKGHASDERVDLALADASDDPALVALFDDAADKLACVIANACTLLNPEMVLLGGGVFMHCPRFREKLLERILPLVLEVSRTGLLVAECALGERAALLGAAALGRQCVDQSAMGS